MNSLNTIDFAEPIIRGINNITPKLPAAVAAFLFGLLVVKLLSLLAELVVGMVRLPKGLRGIVLSLVDILLWVFLLIAVLQALGLSNLALVLSGSVAALGLALGAGASSLAADILAGIFLAQDRDFSVGDEVSAGEKPTQGVVESMDMRRTRIRDAEGRLHVIPNSVIERKEWTVVMKKKDR